MSEIETIQPHQTAIHEVPFTQVKLLDHFWAPRRETNKKVSIPFSLSQLEKAGNIYNLKLASGRVQGDYHGPVFMDSDLYKAIEAVGYSLATDPDPELEKQADSIIDEIVNAQMEDGYLDSWFQALHPDKRWTNLRDNHELYCAGHLFEAAAAYYHATGKRKLLDAAIRLADHIDGIFGDAPGKRMGYPGHPEIELALIKLWRATGEKRYFDLARFFVENRGTHFFAREHGDDDANYDGTYWQDDVPIREHNEIKGHAVRACYLMAGVADVAAETGDRGLLDMMGRVWNNTVNKRLYITGGIGPSAHNEGFTTDYDLPNRTAYQETCASVSMILWSHRLNIMTGDSRYADIMEQTLYNGFLAGVSLDGKRFFYDNPLASDGAHHRSEWFGCACCPPNVTRTLAALGQYLYAVSPGAFWVNLYVQGHVQANLDGREVKLKVTTRYPEDGNVQIEVNPGITRAFSIKLRQPGWCRTAQLKVNGAAVYPELEKGYLVLNRTWKENDIVEVDFRMPVVRVEANPKVTANAGRLAASRGPLIFCMEACDHSLPLESILLPENAELRPSEGPKELGSPVVLKGTGLSSAGGDWDNKLYRPAAPMIKTDVTLIPYYAWDNRDPGEMEVWIPR
jgi:DUF1680 family protein